MRLHGPSPSEPLSRTQSSATGSPAALPTVGTAALLALAAVLAGAGDGRLAAQAPPRPDAEATEGPWSMDDVLTEESAGQFRISPDGERVAWVRSKMDPEAGRRVSNLWMTRLPEGESWPLTRGDDRNHSPRWSPDGELVVYLSSEAPEGSEEDAAGGDQVWALRADGGEPWPVTTGMRGVRDAVFRGGSVDSLVVLARETESRYEQALEEQEDDTNAVEDTLTELPHRLWSVEIGSGDVRRLTRNDDWIQEFAVSPDGSTAAVVAGRDLSYEFDGQNPPRTFLVDLATGSRTEIVRADSIVPRDLEWARDGSGVYFTYPVSSHPVYEIASVSRVGFWDAEAGRLRPVDLGWDRGVGAFAGIEVVPGGFLALLADGVRYRPARFERSGDGAWRRRELRGEHVPQIFAWSASPDGGRVAYTTSAADRPTQPYAARLEDRRLSDPVRLDRLNPGHEDKPVPRAEVVRWTGARGDTVEGLLHYPLDHREGRRYPLVVSPHGGPPSADLDAWSQSWADPTVLYNQRGAFVFKPNYHGSANYGLEWVESIGGGNYYELEIPDIQKGVDRLVERGLVHPDSVAAQGWSNGAILSIQLTVEDPGRYRAAAVGAGDVEWISDWGTVAFAAVFDDYYFGGSLFDIPQVYMEKSPLFDLPEVETPTLIFHGTEDRAVYPAQGWSHFRALQQRTDTPVRFLLFPGEPHGLREYAHQRRKVAEELRWMDAHLWGEEPAASLALKTGSPLDLALERSRAARSEGRLGVLEDGVLVPETVPWRRIPSGGGAADGSGGGERADGGDAAGAGAGGGADGTIAEIGRFEVTRAQWAEFTGEADYPAGTGDHPVSGVSAERARAYVAWLSRRTGDTWRLPDAGALRELARRAPSGNTLDRWAGYSPNPADAGRLREAATRLRGEAPLLEEAGAFAPHDLRGPGPGPTTSVWNLGGNVAEWAAGPDGPVAVGRSADRPDDARARPSDAGPDYVGVRVVRVR